MDSGAVLIDVRDRSIEADASENILQNMEVISKLASQSLGGSRPYSLYSSFQVSN